MNGQFCQLFKKKKSKIEDIINLYQVLRKNRSHRVMEDDIREQMIEDITISCWK